MVHKSLNSSSNSPNSQIPWEFNDLEFAVLETCLSTWLPFWNTLEGRAVQKALRGSRARPALFHLGSYKKRHLCCTK